MKITNSHVEPCDKSLRDWFDLLAEGEKNYLPLNSRNFPVMPTQTSRATMCLVMDAPVPTKDLLSIVMHCVVHLVLRKNALNFMNIAAYNNFMFNRSKILEDTIGIEHTNAIDYKMMAVANAIPNTSYIVSHGPHSNDS